MPIYKQTTEITNIDKVWANINKDIVEVYFGDKNVFTVWAEIENALPLTVYASGDDLANYKVFGNNESGESVGELTENLFDPNATDTTNGYRFSAYLPDSGSIVIIDSETPRFAVSEYIGVPNDNFITLINVGMVEAPRLAICFYNANKEYISGTEYGSNIDKTVEIPSGSVYFRFTIVLSAISSIMIVSGSTAPASYIPYGYKLPMMSKTDNLLSMDDVLVGYWNSATTDWDINHGNGNYRSTKTTVLAGTYTFSFSKPVNVVRIKIGETWIYDGNSPAPEYQNVTSLTITANTDADIGISARNAKSTATPWGDTTIELVKSITTPIYIGSDPLAEDEYVDFGEQKIYRMEGGTLTPTDPPVPIPALPTIEGETIIDYNPSTTPAVEPDKMYVKYRKQGT